MNAVAEPAKGAAFEERQAAFAALATRHAQFLYRVAFGLLRDRQDAEDAVQDTLLKLYRGEAWLAMEDEKAFLATAVWRTGLDRLSTAGARARKHSQDVAAMEIASDAPTPEQQVLDEDRRGTMRRLIEALPEVLRQPLVLSAVEGMRSCEVAAILGVPEGTVRTRVMRARAELREQFLSGQRPLVEVRR